MNILYLAIETIVYFLLCLLIEVGLTFPAFAALFDRVRDPGYPVDEVDSDVAAEAERVLSGKSSGECVRLERLRKVFNSPVGPKIAVQNLSFAIPSGECFGFLGINGACDKFTLLWWPTP